MMVLGMNWGYVPIGVNYAYDFWSQSDAFIVEALHSEMTLLKQMGVNAIRQGVGIPPRWITYIHEKYGIYTMLNHFVGRYGYSIDGTYVAPTNYQDERTREVIKNDIIALVERYKNTKGLLLWMLGNENNYGLYWSSSEIEDLPLQNQSDARATYLYSLFGEITAEIKKRDLDHPVAIANGDVQFIDVIKKEAGNIDIFGSNVYRGKSSRDIFQVVKDTMDIPFMYTEFGADAYNAKEKREDDVAQAMYLRDQWQEIYEQSYGKGRVGNAIGGATFQWSDGWWKYNQESNLSIHDTTASWANGGYPHDFVDGQNNMNEEWFGICAKGKNDERGFYRVYPRAAYYLLQEGYKLPPYGTTTTLERIREHWSKLQPRSFGKIYASDKAELMVKDLSVARISNFVLDFSTVTSGGTQLTDETRTEDRFDHLQSIYLGAEVSPNSQLKASATLNVLGNVPINPIDELYFENRGLKRSYVSEEGLVEETSGIERVMLYQGEVDWEHDYFNLNAFYRVGQNHWGYEGDFFGLFPESHYPEAVDIYGGVAPNGMIFEGKKTFEGLKVAFGPELYWGANPGIIAKYHREKGPLEFSFMHQEDISRRADAVTSSQITMPKTRKSSLFLGYTWGKLELNVGALMAGTDRLGRNFQVARNANGKPGYLDSDYFILNDKINYLDTLGTKLRLKYTFGKVQMYAQGAYKGLVSDSGADFTTTFTGWSLKESGQGNHYHFLAGSAVNIGDFQVAPNFLFQKPLEGPLPSIGDYFDAQSGRYFPGVQPRNLLNDPFWVRSNRETIGFELLLAYDPVPATWLWQWDNLFRENAPLAAYLDFVYRIQPTSQDAGVAIAEEGFIFAFDTVPTPKNIWEVKGRIISNPLLDLRLILNAYGGWAESTGSDNRLIRRYGGDLRLIYKALNVEGYVKVDDWGPYDYHRDFNLTFPLQLMADISYAVGKPKWFTLAYSRLGIRAKYRTLDEFSPRFLLDSTNPDQLGTEWEIRTYLNVSLDGGYE